MATQLGGAQLTAMVLGMAAPPVAKPQPKPALKEVATPCPEFMCEASIKLPVAQPASRARTQRTKDAHAQTVRLQACTAGSHELAWDARARRWCQRSDRVFVTIKVADCSNAKIDVTPEHVLEFRGTGHGMCGQRDYQLSVELAAPVVASACKWFVSGPSLRVILQKEKVGPYWGNLLAGKRKMVQLKVDWASWLDEDEETERSAAPNGFEVSEMKMMMVGSDKDPLYRDLDVFESSATPDEGEELNSILIDEGMNSIDDLQIKFKALEYEREELAKTKAARYEQRKKTREAQLFVKQRENDLKYGRPTRDLTAEEEGLLANAEGLYERLKEEKKTEKLYWLSKWWHQRRPEKRKIDMAEPVARQAALDQITLELQQIEASGADIHDPRTRRQVERRIFQKSRDAALDKFNEWEIVGESRKQQDIEGREYTARDLGARITREELAKALGEPVPELAHSLRLKQFADNHGKKIGAWKGDEAGSAADDDDEEEEAPSRPKALTTNAAAEEGGLELEDNEGGLELEDNGGGLELEDNEGGLELGDNNTQPKGGTVV